MCVGGSDVCFRCGWYMWSGVFVLGPRREISIYLFIGILVKLLKGRFANPLKKKG